MTSSPATAYRHPQLGQLCMTQHVWRQKNNDSSRLRQVHTSCLWACALSAIVQSCSARCCWSVLLQPEVGVGVGCLAADVLVISHCMLSSTVDLSTLIYQPQPSRQTGRGASGTHEYVDTND